MRVDKDHIHSHPCLRLLTGRPGRVLEAAAGGDTAAQAEKDRVRAVNVLSEQGPRSTIQSPLQKKSSKKKNPDYTEKYRFKCLTFLMRGSFSSFYLVHPLFIYLWSVLCCLELSRWGGLLRLEGGAPAWRL